jgi:RNA polymerase sigma-70 factor (ECF subfamily)
MGQMDTDDIESNEQGQIRLFLDQRSRLVRYVSMITGNATLAEDIVQESWMRFSAAVAGQVIQEPQRFLFRIARNLALDSRRRRTLEDRLFIQDGDDALSVASEEPDAMRSAEAVSELSFILDALEKLPERTRQAFILHRFKGMRLVDIGVRLKISKSVAHELIVDAVEHCRKARERAT